VNEDIEQAKERLKRIIDFYKLNDENNYDYSDEVLISMRLVLEENERLEKRNKEIYEGFMATQEELKEYAEEIERLNNIIDKAINYIDRRDLEWGSDEHNKMMNILKGSDKE
jgi:acetolactate synthase small subunit